MALLRTGRVAPSLRHISRSQHAHTSRRNLSSTPQFRSSHESHYDPPGGWLWGIPPGQKYQKEGWETMFYWGFCGSMGLATVAYCYKPDTSIQTWALEEARRRLEAEGILSDPDSTQSK
ncbi:NADH-ubiquinone oxidoreductase [Aulographum hederae CBS 113979]|uniref:NADH dehydrogenase [ubiquinone] 1 beta subcomplex subunit 11, mitochondrial n=1 Tax=Aulographum hederae CBS 113979 TaxID=1176131 RepID=A0A6G1GWE6_9PEZI|nr:NADH-ubiquinone oxidoreductase [Aulographum hederae CBS 113979]